MLAIVEHRDQYIQVSQKLFKSRRLVKCDRVVRAIAPFRESLVERAARCFDLIAQRLEHAMQKSFATANGKHIDPRRKRKRHFNELRSILAAALQGGAKHLSDRHAEERRSGVRPIVDVLRKFEARIGVLAADQSDGIDIEEQADG